MSRWHQGIFCFAIMLLTSFFFTPIVSGDDEFSTRPTTVFDHLSFDTKMAQVAVAVENSSVKELHSLLVYKDDALLYEVYFRGNDDRIDFEGGVKRVSGPSVLWHMDRPHYVASVTKTVTALLAGIALQELSLPVNTPVNMLKPDLVAKDAGDLTLHHLLSMRAGFDWDEWTDDDLVQLWQSDDFSAFLLAKPNQGPGSNWAYNSAGPNLVLSLLEARLAHRLAGWARRRFFTPLGITNYKWQNQPTGTPEGAARLILRPRDMLKLGLLILNDGTYQEEEVVQADWVRAMTTSYSQTESGGYGYYIWLREIEGRSYISAEGDGGQYINIFPAERLVIVMTQGNYLEWPFYANQANSLMRDYIFPALNLR